MDFHLQVVALFQQQYPDVRAAPRAPIPDASQPLYQHRPNPPLSIGELRYVAESLYQLPPNESRYVAENILRFMGNLIATLQNNEQSRLAWGGRGKGDRGGLRELQAEVAALGQLVEQCKHGVGSKSQLSQLLERKRREIFREESDFGGRTAAPLILSELPEHYQHLPLLSEESYEIVYESIMQKLLTYQHAVSQYLSAALTFRDFQQICTELMRQDIVLLNSNKTNQLIRYTLALATSRIQVQARLKAKANRLRSGLIASTVRIWFLAFAAPVQIKELREALEGVEQVTLGGGTGLGRNSVGQGGQDGVVRLQYAFTELFNYLTQRSETIYVALHARKLKKRAADLLRIEERLTHFFKLIFNPDYAEQHALPASSQRTIRLDQRLRQAQELFNELRPLDEKGFRTIFQEVQRVGLFLVEIKAGREWKYSLLELEQQVMRQYLFDSSGQRKRRKDGQNLHISRSRINDLSRSFNSYEVTADEVFEDSLDQLVQKRQLLGSRSEQAQLNRQEVLREGQALLESVVPNFGEELRDLSNFKAYHIPRLTKRAEAALSATPYSDQPLYLHLASLVENFKLLPSIIKPEINQDKIALIFHPKVNAQLFRNLRVYLSAHQDSLSLAYVELDRNPVRSGNLPNSLREFMERRLRFLHVLMENADKLEEIAGCVQGLNLKKTSHDIASEGTYALVLRLLLASKELNASQRSALDKMTAPSKTLSLPALRLLTQEVYPNFIKSLSLVFQGNHGHTSLEGLLQLADNSKQLLSLSQTYLDNILKAAETCLNQRNPAALQPLFQEYNLTLKSYCQRLEQLINECSSYSCVSGEALQRQRVRVLEFLQLVQGGARTRAEIIDERAVRLRGVLGALGI